ncbi:MAG: hypothetical protein JWL82_47 [Parcubacteria group bacterium]|nr:hypothetical protein [Parcubacteria group bacterium]
MFVLVPALLIAAVLTLTIMGSSVHAQEIVTSSAVPASVSAPANTTATSTGSRATIASTSGTTLPDSAGKVLSITRTAVTTTPSDVPELSPVGIHTSDELYSYAKTLMQKNASIETITLSGTEVSVRYHRNARLLGILPVSVPGTVSVRTDGSVSFSNPWYRMLTIAERDYLTTALEVRVHSLLTSEGYLASMHLAPSTQAELLATITELLSGV